VGAALVSGFLGVRVGSGRGLRSSPSQGLRAIAIGLKLLFPRRGLAECGSQPVLVLVLVLSNGEVGV
jgi:hypothetical protein